MPDATDHKELPPIAKVAWKAYLRMSATKNTYFEFMQSLDQKYDKGESPTEEENQELAVMLQAHSKTVAEFNEAMHEVTDTDDRTLLLKKMG